jgi:hypothetical protein
VQTLIRRGPVRSSDEGGPQAITNSLIVNQARFVDSYYTKLTVTNIWESYIRKALLVP